MDLRESFLALATAQRTIAKGLNMAKKKQPTKPAFVEIPWTAARAWLAAQGISRAAAAIGVKPQSLHNALQKDNLSPALAQALSELSCGKFGFADFYPHPRIGTVKAHIENGKLMHALAVSNEST